VGTVLNDKNDQSIIVGVTWSQRHRVYSKSRRKVTRLVAHDPENQATIGDRVLIEETRPLSRTKRWRLVDIVEKVDVAEFQPSEIDPESVEAVTSGDGE
jgi:small subunit ribosomal protein S17